MISLIIYYALFATTIIMPSCGSHRRCRRRLTDRPTAADSIALFPLRRRCLLLMLLCSHLYC